MDASSPSNPKAEKADALDSLKGRARQRSQGPLQSSPPSSPLFSQAWRAKTPLTPPTKKSPLSSSFTPEPKTPPARDSAGDTSSPKTPPRQTKPASTSPPSTGTSHKSLHSRAFAANTREKWEAAYSGSPQGAKQLQSPRYWASLPTQPNFHAPTSPRRDIEIDLGIDDIRAVARSISTPTSPPKARKPQSVRRDIEIDFGLNDIPPISRPVPAPTQPPFHAPASPRREIEIDLGLNDMPPASKLAPVPAPPPRPRPIPIPSVFLHSRTEPIPYDTTPSQAIWTFILKYVLRFDPSQQASMVKNLTGEQSAYLVQQRKADFRSGFVLGALIVLVAVQVWLASGEGGPLSLEALRARMQRFLVSG